MGKIEAQLGAFHGVASRFAVLQDESSSDEVAYDAKKLSRDTKSKKSKATGKIGNKQKGIEVDLRAAAFQTSTKTKKNKSEKTKGDHGNNNELEKLKALFAKSSMNCMESKENSEDDSLKPFISKHDFKGESNDSTQAGADINCVQSNHKNEIKEEKFNLKEHLGNTKDVINGKKPTEQKRNDTKKNTSIQLENTSALQNQYKIDLEKKDLEISNLKCSNELLTSEIEKIKKRYKTMRSILDQSELKEKVELVAEAQKLRTVKDEMSQNIITLTRELEQYKTKTQGLNLQLRQMQGKQKYSIPG